VSACGGLSACDAGDSARTISDCPEIINHLWIPTPRTACTLAPFTGDPDWAWGPGGRMSAWPASRPPAIRD